MAKSKSATWTAEEICESHVFSYSHQRNTITFCGEGKLEISYMDTQGGGNEKRIHKIKLMKGLNL